MAKSLGIRTDIILLAIDDDPATCAVIEGMVAGASVPAAVRTTTDPFNALIIGAMLGCRSRLPNESTRRKVRLEIPMPLASDGTTQLLKDLVVGPHLGHAGGTDGQKWRETTQGVERGQG